MVFDNWQLHKYDEIVTVHSSFYFLVRFCFEGFAVAVCFEVNGFLVVSHWNRRKERHLVKIDGTNLPPIY